MGYFQEKLDALSQAMSENDEDSSEEEATEAMDSSDRPEAGLKAMGIVWLHSLQQIVTHMHQLGLSVSCPCYLLPALRSCTTCPVSCKR